VHKQQLNYRNDDDFNYDNDYSGDVSPRGDRSASHRVIPRQQLRPMPSEEDDYYRSGRGDYDDEYDAAPARRAPAAANSAKKASHYSPPRRTTPGNAGSYSHRRNPDDDEDDGWDEDSNPGKRDTPPHFGTSDAYDSYGNDEDYPYGSARGHKKESSGYGARLPPSYPVPQDKVSGSGRPAMKIDKEAPPLPVEMKYAPPPPNRDDAPPKEKLYFSRQPRNVEYKYVSIPLLLRPLALLLTSSFPPPILLKSSLRPYSLAEWRAKKPNDYVEIKPTLQPDLNSEVLQAKRANQERVKEFSKNLLTFNQQVLRQQRKLPRSSESNDIERADQRAVSKRERAKQFAQNIPKPKPAASSVAMPSMAGGSYRAGSHFRATDDEEDWAGKDGLDHDYMGRVAQRDSSAIGGISDVEFRRIELLEQKHNDASRQIAAIKKSLGV
jgi:hypothetical protein